MRFMPWRAAKETPNCPIFARTRPITCHAPGCSGSMRQRAANKNFYLNEAMLCPITPGRAYRPQRLPQVQGVHVPMGFTISRAAQGRILPFWKGRITSIRFVSSS